MKSEPGDRPSARGGHIGQEELERIPVTSHGTGPESILNFEVVFEKSEKHLTDTAHSAPPFGAAAWKRQSASRSNSSVMGKYTAVELGSTWPKKVAKCMSRELGSMPSRYQRSNVRTANDRRRS